MSEKHCTIELLGTSISISTEEELYYIETLVKRVESVIQEVKNSLGLNEPLSVAIMTAIFLADECTRLNQDNQSIKLFPNEFSALKNLSSESIYNLQVQTGDKLAHIESMLDRTLKQC